MCEKLWGLGRSTRASGSANWWLHLRRFQLRLIQKQQKMKECSTKKLITTCHIESFHLVALCTKHLFPHYSSRISIVLSFLFRTTHC